MLEGVVIACAEVTHPQPLIQEIFAWKRTENEINKMTAEGRGGFEVRAVAFDHRSPKAIHMHDRVIKFTSNVAQKFDSD